MKNIENISYLDIKNYLISHGVNPVSDLNDNELFTSLNSISNANENELQNNVYMISAISGYGIEKITKQILKIGK